MKAKTLEVDSTIKSREAIDLDFHRYLLMLKRRWILTVGIFFATAGFGVFATTLMKPSYEAAGKLLFRIPAFNIVGSNLLPNSSEGEFRGLRALVSTQNPISTEVEVITSYPLLQRTIDALKLKNNQGKPLTVKALAKNLDLKIVGGTDVLQITYKSRNPEEAAAVVNSVMNVYLENDILTNRTEVEATRRFMARQLPQTQAAVSTAEVALRKFKQQNNIVDLTEEARSAVTIIGGLDTEINTVKASLNEITAQSNELRKKVGLDSPQAIAMSTLSQSPAVQGALTQYQDIERQLATERSRFSEAHPTIVNLEARKSNLKTLLQQQINQTLGKRTTVSPKLLQIGELQQGLITDFLRSEVQRLGLAQRLTSLSNSRATYEQRMQKMPQLEQTLRELQRTLEVAQSTYQNLLRKTQELQVAEHKNTANARIISQALVPEEPVLKKKIIVVVLSVMFGAFLSTTTVLLLEMRDRSLKTLQEIRQVFEYTLLGIIPTSPVSHKTMSFYLQDTESITPSIAVRDRPYSLTSEMYRMLQANLKFLSSDKELKTIVVTSSVPKEGKSSVSANLALAISQMGRKVLLIDADMRVPSQHKIWELSHTSGLSDVLVGQSQFNETVSQVTHYLDVLTAGVRPPNPLALLDSKRMALLIQDFSDQYDVVIIDSPPLLLAADALTLSQMSDGILLVARPGVIDNSSADTVQEMLERCGHNVLGLVVNGLIEQNEFGSYFYHAQEYFSSENLPKEASADLQIR
ncbi:capsular exopolysaccharide biosynthesis protein [Nostoc sp. PCC 7524]|uniref:GumC family protein n=1 Tax=Nostoc sp. (strain ATCC 29411 / PCC 7524) TaxID=28072 RepID=UPI00029F1FA1|nr:polysaccharide biosynthesis tyrosine autokinase [Nostoc sp. PCC 7524]AFY46256.1 capsular exopolysaccharide biosynthesis protein [Nostoc sp. PCC 7524]